MTFWSTNRSCSQLSHYSEKGPVFVLIGELVETVKSIGLSSPLASIFTEFAATAIEMLDQPSHAMYGKINKFLQKSPSWDVAKFISYWTEKILLREPEDNMKGLFQEITWLLNLLLQGLRDNEVRLVLIDASPIANVQIRTWNCIGKVTFSSDS
jgi:Nucleolar pre-ribosomal-associated protein 1